MGNFGGHFIPGALFLCFAVFWSFCQWKRYFKGLYKLGKPYEASFSYPCHPKSKCGKFHWEGALKAVLCFIALVIEIITSVFGPFSVVTNLQHVTMYSFFGFTGVVDILLFYSCPLPKNSDYAINVVSYAIEGLLFLFHLHGRFELDAILHTLLVYAIWFCVLAVLLEWRYPHSIIASQARCFGSALQGTCFIQVGCMLFPPLPFMHRWVAGDPNDSAGYKGATEAPESVHHNIMLATIIFCCHVFVIILCIMSMGLLVSRYYRRYAGKTTVNSSHLEKLLDNEELSDLEDEKLEFSAKPERDNQIHRDTFL